MQFAIQLKKLMEKNGWTKYRVAKLCNVSQTTVNNWITGAYTPYSKDWPAIAKALNTSEMELFGAEFTQKKPDPTNGDGLEEFIQIMGELDASRRSKLLELARLYLDDQRRSEEKE